MRKSIIITDFFKRKYTNNLEVNTDDACIGDFDPGQLQILGPSLLTRHAYLAHTSRNNKRQKER